MMEFYLEIQSDSGLLSQSSALRRWSTAYLNSLGQSNVPQGRKDRHAPQRLQTWMTNAGFTNINSIIRNMPMSPWSEGKVPSYLPKGLLLTKGRSIGTTDRPMESPKHEEHDEGVLALPIDKAPKNATERIRPAPGQRLRRTRPIVVEALPDIVGSTPGSMAKFSDCA